MDKALYIAMTGAKHNMYSQTAHSNNLANVNTTGFRGDWEQARSMSVFGEHYPSRAYALSERPATDFRPGPLIETGNDLDIALGDTGFIAIQSADGTEAYSRRGDLSLLANGALVNGLGQPIIGEGGPIILPEAQKISIAEDGLISISPPGTPPDTLVVVDQIKRVNPDPRTLIKDEQGVFRPQQGPAVLPADPLVKLVSGFLEGSNVNPVHALTSLLSLSHQYEVQVKMMKTTEDISRASEQLLRIS